MFVYIDVEQGSDEWLQQRCGSLGASQVHDVLSKTKSGYSAMRGNAIARIAVEKLTGIVQKTYKSVEMQWGNDTEPQARAAYEFLTDAEVIEEGFVLHPAIADFGASPDGLIGDVGLLEIKCPNTAAHIETLLTGEVPGKYVTQMQAQMACTGRAWCDFVSFDPRMPGDMQLFVRRVVRDDAFLAQMGGEITSFFSKQKTAYEITR